LLRIGIKFCGGCNPAFDRVAAVERIKRELEGKAEFVPLDDETAEMVLAVMGCGNACAELGEIKGKQVIIITEDSRVDAVIDEIKRKHVVL
jgi:hypothetical protein